MRPLLPVLVVAVVPALAAQRPAGGAPVAEVVTAIEEVDALRSGLAATLEGRTTPPDPQVFAQVCRPVGQRLKAVATERGWQAVQMAERNRNPAHALDAEGRTATRFFLRHPEATALWIRTRLSGVPGARYFRRITVEKSCLACHGERDRRPEFIRQNYPEDRAFGFRPGDLRGVYAVFVPDSLAGAGPPKE